MGDHYIPRYYLEGFTRPGSAEIWTYDKSELRKFASQPKSIANESNFYSRDVEQNLAEKVEQPANRVLQKIRSGEHISEEEKLILSTYIIVMWKRVPESKAQFRQEAPQITENLLEQFKRQFEHAIVHRPENSRMLTRRLQQIEEILLGYSTDPPKDIWLDIIDPVKTPQSIDTFSQMTWRFLVYDTKPVFLTCDNPVFFFKSLGIVRSNSELTFPISSNVALLATWKQHHQPLYQNVGKRIVAEFNRRTVSNATRFIFHALDEDWIVRLVKKSKRKFCPLIHVL